VTEVNSARASDVEQPREWQQQPDIRDLIRDQPARDSIPRRLDLAPDAERYGHVRDMEVRCAVTANAECLATGGHKNGHRGKKAAVSNSEK
jgi:hypothetical protein